jgi:hypothetical protein
LPQGRKGISAKKYFLAEFKQSKYKLIVSKFCLAKHAMSDVFFCENFAHLRIYCTFIFLIFEIDNLNYPGHYRLWEKVVDLQ